jgi:DNA-directed RNA polymerase subunit K/omega
MYDTTDAEAIARRAREIAAESRQLEDERHDEFDDPDLGGEG